MNKEEDQKLKYINVHCHFLNFKYIPDSFFKIQGFSERFLKNFLFFFGWIFKLNRFISRLFGPSNRIFIAFSGFIRFFTLLEIDDVNEIADLYNKQMEDAGIILATPLMMDIEISSFNQKPECPYRYQIQEISDIAARYPGKIMPFIMFDPRRETKTEELEAKGTTEEMKSNAITEALEEYGFLGVKMYPALGYDPDNESIYNDYETNKKLKLVYEYCNNKRKRISITTHCSKGGSYSSELMRYHRIIEYLNDPRRWEKVIEKYPYINFNFAHFGGFKDFMNANEKYYMVWTDKIREFMRKNNNVYADISSHLGALNPKHSEKYFEILKGLLDEKKNDKYLYRDRILFGTDWMFSFYNEDEYVRTFFNNLGEDRFNIIAIRNPIKFLFPNYKLPERIKKFYKEKNKNYPSWLNNIEKLLSDKKLLL